MAACVTTAAGADCFDDAASYHGVNPWVLRAIAVVETAGCMAGQVNRNTNGTVDIGCMQTNSIHLNELGRHGVRAGDLMDPCKSIHVGGWQLRRKINKYGNTWTAVGPTTARRRGIGTAMRKRSGR